MSASEWLPMLAIAAAVGVAAMLAWHLRAGRQRASALAPVQARVAASRSELRELERRLAAGELAPEAFAEEQQRVAATLLEMTPVDATPRRPPAAFLAVAGAAALFAAFAFHFWASRAVDRSAAPVAAAPAATRPAPPASSANAGTPVRALSEAQLQHMIDEAGAQTRKAPTDAAAWAMLAHSYDMLGKFAESSKAYATLARLLPNDAQVLADYADALAVANGRTLTGQPTELVERALRIDPKNVKALALSGTAAYERADYAPAIAYWERALAAAPDPAFRQQIERSIVDARSAARGEPAPRAEVGGASSAAADRGGPAIVSGRVTLADDLVARAPPDAAVYVFARPTEGSRMPVALLRKHVRDLPLDFSLDDSSAMVAEARLSTVRSVVIGARISRRGDVTPQPGDMQGWSAPVPVGTRGIRLEISEVLK
jgi:cytochrome c-type biogenesis protein CcmH